ncbi:helix-turn-helix domain-containing protein [Clostridium sp.]|uniref:helix-turn-helix domain-containing protein n=1 Tax=Clostridium sp. TaxID=1506 RepID=UPI002618DE42
MTRLKEIREEKGISQRELAKRINISAPRYNQYENNKRSLPPKIALLLAKELNVTIDEIYR